VEYSGDLMHLDETLDNTKMCSSDDVVSQASVEYEPVDVIEKEDRSQNTSLSKNQLYFKRYLRFINSPRVIFFYEIFFFSIYLLLFSYWLLVKFNYYETGEASVHTPGNTSDVDQLDPDPDVDDDEDDEDEATSPMILAANRTTRTTTPLMSTTTQIVGLLKKRKKFIPGKTVKKMIPPVFIEYLLVYWVIMFFIEEISQVS
jgi:hypothetical protein